MLRWSVSSLLLVVWMGVEPGWGAGDFGSESK